MAAIGRAAIEGRRRLPSRRKTAIAIDRRLMINEKLAPANFSDRYVSFSTRIIREIREKWNDCYGEIKGFVCQNTHSQRRRFSDDDYQNFS